MTTLRKLAVLAATSGLALTMAACGSSGGSAGNSSGGPSNAANKGSITIGSANFTESELIARMYGDALTNAGYTVTVKANIGNREVYIKALESGEIDVVPEYVGTVTEYYNAAINGTDAATNKPIATSDPAATDKALNTLIASRGLIASPTSPAADQNAFAVTQAFAKKNNVSTLSDLKKLNGTLVLGGPPECPTRPFCQLGLQQTYGLQFKSFKPTDSGGPVTFGALTDGTIDLGLVFSSDGTVAADKLTILKDDKNLQQADNILALMRKTVPADAQAVINKVNASFTTEDLQTLNKQISVDKDEPAALAATWVKDHKLG